MQTSGFQFYFRLARALARQFGPSCEVVVHDLESKDPERSIVAIENGHVSGRQIGDGPSHIVLDALNGDRAHLQDHLAYLTKTKDGRILKSSTVYILDDEGKARGIFSVNYDITLMLSMESALRAFTATDQPESEPAPISRNVSDLLDELIAQSVDVVGKPAALMSKEEKIRAIQFLNDSGAFLITKAGDRISRFFGISKYTLYNYIDEAKAQSASD